MGSGFTENAHVISCFSCLSAPYGTHWAGGAGADIDDTWPTGQLAAEDENYAPFVSEDWTEVGRVEGRRRHLAHPQEY